MQFTMSLISKKVDTNDHDLTTFMLPYSTTVWLVTLACLLFVTILMYLVNLFSPYGHRSRHMQYGETGEEFNFFNSLWFCLASMLQQGADHTPKSFSGQLYPFESYANLVWNIWKWIVLLVRPNCPSSLIDYKDMHAMLSGMRTQHSRSIRLLACLQFKVGGGKKTRSAKRNPIVLRASRFPPLSPLNACQAG